MTLSAVRFVWARRTDIPASAATGAWFVAALVLGGSGFALPYLPATGLLWLARRPAAAELVRWSGHFFAMVAAMDAGMSVYHGLLRPALLTTSAADLTRGDVGFAAMVLSMAIGMALLMRLEGHAWHMVGEMTLAMVLPVVLVAAGVAFESTLRLGALTWLSPANRYDLAHVAMLVGMLLLMGIQFGMYTGSALTHDRELRDARDGRGAEPKGAAA